MVSRVAPVLRVGPPLVTVALVISPVTARVAWQVVVVCCVLCNRPVLRKRQYLLVEQFPERQGS